jgi:hypothetical protein
MHEQACGLPCYDQHKLFHNKIVPNRRKKHVRSCGFARAEISHAEHYSAVPSLLWRRCMPDDCDMVTCLYLYMLWAVPFHFMLISAELRPTHQLPKHTILGPGNGSRTVAAAHVMHRGSLRWPTPLA